MRIDNNDPLAVEITKAIQKGDLPTIERLLREHPGLASGRIGDADGSVTLLHTATDWPGHFPNGPAVVTALVRAGADVNAKVENKDEDHHQETPLHWAASSDDVAVIDVLLDNGADINANGGVIGNGSPLFDATVFAQWNAARRLVERGAHPTFFDAAALGLLDWVKRYAEEATDPLERTKALWAACHGGQREAAEYLIGLGADINWVSEWDGLTPLDTARRDGFEDVAEWLVSLGAISSDQQKAQS